MSRAGSVIILLRAVSRLSPRMAVFMARRAARNKLARWCPRAYRARLARIAQSTPALAPGAARTSADAEMTEFYCAEYRDQIDAVRAGRVNLHGRTVDFGAPIDIDWRRHLPDEGDHQMWRIKLAHMGFVCPMLAEGDAGHYDAVADIITGFRRLTDVTDAGAFNAYWFPYAASHRILAVASGLLAARTRGDLDPATDALVADFLKENVAFVLDNIEYELCNNHVERNLAALCLYFSHVDQVPTRVAARLERDIRRLIHKTILPDGVQIERSPMYQGLCVASLAMMASAPFLSASLRADLQEKTRAARRAFAILCHPDGQVAVFNDSWHGEVPHLKGPAAPDGRSILADGGYARLSQGHDLCLLDAGPIGPSWNPGHGHADFLSVEVTLGGRRLIVDPGTSRYNSGLERARERSSAAHNGPADLAREPVEFLGCFKVGRLAEAGLLPVERLPEATIGGVFRNRGDARARLVRHYPGEGFLFADAWKAPHAHGQVAWLVPGIWAVEQADRQFLMRHSDGAKAVLTVLSDCERDAPLASHWTCQYGRRDPAWELRLRPGTIAGASSLLCWIGHGAPPQDAVRDGDALLNHLHSLVQQAG